MNNCWELSSGNILEQIWIIKWIIINNEKRGRTRYKIYDHDYVIENN